MTSRWVTIRVCEYAEALVLRGELEANGIPVDVPGESMLRSDLFLRGGNGFALEVRVPESAVDAARELLAPFDDAETRALAGGDERAPVAEPPSDPSARSVAERVRWGSTSWWLAPWAFVAGVRHGPGANASPAEKRDHVYALVAASLSTASFVVFVALMLSGMFD